MASKTPIHAFFSLGLSPAVITEGLWALTVTHGHTVGAVEIWTTTDGQRVLKEQHDLFRAAVGALREQVGDRLPALPTFPELHNAPPADDATWQIRLLTDGQGASLDDARTQEQLDYVLAALSDRLRTICRDRQRPLHAILAGGRKTMSSSLQQAFSMQAGVADRLWHVLLHERLDRPVNPRDGGAPGVLSDRTYWMPTPEHAERFDVPLDDQVVLIEVPTPRLHVFFEANQSSRPASEEPAWMQDWGHWTRPRITLGLTGLTFNGSNERIQVDLGTNERILLTALTLCRAGVDTDTLNGLLTRDLGNVDGARGEKGRISSAINKIRDKLRALPPALSFLRIGDARPAYILAGAARIELAPELNNGGHLDAVLTALRELGADPLLPVGAAQTP